MKSCFWSTPNQSEQVPAMIDRYKEMVTAGEGQGTPYRRLGPPSPSHTLSTMCIKHHYVMINIECSLDVLREIERNFKFNDSILRHLVIKQKSAQTEESPFAKAKAEEDRIDEEKRKSAEARTSASTAAKEEVKEEAKEEAKEEVAVAKEEEKS